MEVDIELALQNSCKLNAMRMWQVGKDRNHPIPKRHEQSYIGLILKLYGKNHSEKAEQNSRMFSYFLSFAFRIMREYLKFLFPESLPCMNYNLHSETYAT